MSFQKDLKDGQFGQKIALAHLKKVYKDYQFVETSGRNENFDICATDSDDRDGNGMPYGADIIHTWEVKYDIMAAKTGNLCFELSNGKKGTGLLSSAATYVIYVVPTEVKGEYNLFTFQRSWLINKLFLMSLEKDKALRIVKGGDDNRFLLALISINDACELLNPEISKILYKDKNGKKIKTKKRV